MTEKGGLLNLVPVRKSYSSRVQKLLDIYGNLPIKKIIICRTPLQKFINVALNIMTLGRWQKAVKENGYDNMFHLYCVVFVDYNGKEVQLKVEKNEIINVDVVNIDFNSAKAGEWLMITQRVPKGLTLNQMLQNTLGKMGESLYWNYSAFAPNNCQTFIKYFLDSNGLLTPVELNYIDQNVQNIAKSAIFKPVKVVSDVVTGIASRFRTLTGTGLENV